MAVAANVIVTVLGLPDLLPTLGARRPWSEEEHGLLERPRLAGQVSKVPLLAGQLLGKLLGPATIFGVGLPPTLNDLPGIAGAVTLRVESFLLQRKHEHSSALSVDLPVDEASAGAIEWVENRACGTSSVARAVIFGTNL